MREKKILLVDDDYKNAILLKRFLEEEFDKVIYAENGRIAWTLFSTLKPDLVLLDINMPQMNGFELAQKIRDNDRQVIIFFLTDRTEISDRLKGFSLKANDYIPKPFYPEELIAKMKERFETPKPQEEKNVFQLGSIRFDYSLCRIESGGEIRKLSLRQADILLILIRRLNFIVERDYILENVWKHNSYANSLALNVQITYLRRILNTDKSVNIEALKKKGYILRAPLAQTHI